MIIKNVKAWIVYYYRIENQKENKHIVGVYEDLKEAEKVYDKYQQEAKMKPSYTKVIIEEIEITKECH